MDQLASRAFICANADFFGLTGLRLLAFIENKMRIIDFLSLLKFHPQNCPSGPKSSMCTKAQIAAIHEQAKHKLEMVAIEMRACGQKMLKASTREAGF